jgi:hypothetical protein
LGALAGLVGCHDAPIDSGDGDDAQGHASDTKPDSPGPYGDGTSQNDESGGSSTFGGSGTGPVIETTVGASDDSDPGETSGGVTDVGTTGLDTSGSNGSSEEGSSSEGTSTGVDMTDTDETCDPLAEDFWECCDRNGWPFPQCTPWGPPAPPRAKTSHAEQVV